MPTSAPKLPTRADRRRERTRARLLEAARELFAEQGVGATRLGEISERADVAAGSLYNHFSGKDEIVDAVMAEITEEQGKIVDAMTADLDDPAEVVAFAHRHFVRLAATEPHFAQLIVRLDASHRLMTKALGPRALRDIQRGLDAGRFDFPGAEAAVTITGGALLGAMRGVSEGRLGPDADEVQAAAVLRMLGLTPSEAAEISRRAIPAA
ncbi:MAG: helix-turn-helix domain-containing protein [Solirubrobacterales bacterium]